MKTYLLAVGCGAIEHTILMMTNIPILLVNELLERRSAAAVAVHDD